MVLVMARQEAGQREQRLNSLATLSEDAQIRAGKLLLAAKNLNGKRQRDSLNKSVLTLSHGVLMKVELLSM
jgi:hypothetical protein